MIGPEKLPDEEYWRGLLEEETSREEKAGPRSEGGRNKIDPATEEAWRLAEESHQQQEIKEVVVEGYNRGGLVTSLWGLEGFIPASYLSDLRGGEDEADLKEQLSRYVGRVLQVKVLEVDRPGARLILSPRDSAREPSKFDLSGLAAGKVVRGRITRIADFGAFVDIGGVEGLLHVSEIAWGRVPHPAQVLKVGEEVEVYILDVDPHRRRVALSRKRLLPDPWKGIEEEFKVGQVVEGTVTRVVDFGAFVRLREGVEGLIHLSELAEGNFFHPHNVVREGEVVRVRILNLDPVRHRVGLSLRQV
ncbi:MAG: S1 RNA-binding domain-containing protein [Chloroflexi bacterium]|nr:S1 RNA-binding domain-containing protein [Chloroflexota bacterium]